MAANNASDFARAVSTLAAKDYSAASTNGAAVDTRGYRYAMVVLNAGVAAASAEADVSLESSDASASGFAAISGATFTQVTAANDETVYVGFVNCDASKRYLRAVVACDGTNKVALSVDIVLLQPEVGPATQVNAAEFSV